MNARNFTEIQFAAVVSSLRSAPLDRLTEKSTQENWKDIVHGILFAGEHKFPADVVVKCHEAGLMPASHLVDGKGIKHCHECGTMYKLEQAYEAIADGRLLMGRDRLIGALWIYQVGTGIAPLINDRQTSIKQYVENKFPAGQSRLWNLSDAVLAQVTMKAAKDIYNRVYDMLVDAVVPYACACGRASSASVPETLHDAELKQCFYQIARERGLKGVAINNCLKRLAKLPMFSRVNPDVALATLWPYGATVADVEGQLDSVR